MRLVILGASGTGKTTYLAQVYEQLQAGRRGVTVTAEPAVHEKLLRAAASAATGQGPQLSLDPGGVRLTVQSRFAPDVLVTVCDHSGDALLLPEEDAKAAALQRDLSSADAVMAFVAQEEMADRQPGWPSRAVRDVIATMMRFVPGHGVSYPVVLAIVCSQVPPSGTRPHSGDSLLSPVTEMLSALEVAPHIHPLVHAMRLGASPTDLVTPLGWLLTFGMLRRLRDLAPSLPLGSPEFVQTVDQLEQLTELLQPHDWPDVKERWPWPTHL